MIRIDLKVDNLLLSGPGGASRRPEPDTFFPGGNTRFGPQHLSLGMTVVPFMMNKRVPITKDPAINKTGHDNQYFHNQQDGSL